MMKCWIKWPLGLITNQNTGGISHTKLWANIAAGAATYKFIIEPTPPSEIWLAYLGLVGGYALGQKWLEAKQQQKQNGAQDGKTEE